MDVNTLSMNRSFSIAILISVIVLNFHQILFSEFAYSDSYEFLLNSDGPYFFNRWVQSGRPLFGIGAQWIFTNLNISDLMWVRSFSLLGMSAFSTTLFFISSKYYSNILSLLIAIAVALSPSSIITTLWTSTFQVSWSLLLGLLAGWLVISQIDKSLKIWHFIVVLVLSLISLNLYQPGFTAFIIPIALAFINKKLSTKKLAISIGMHLSIYVIYFTLFKFSLHYYDINPESRSGLDLNIFSSLKWLFKHPFKQASYLGLIFSPKWVLTAFTLLIYAAVVVNGLIYGQKDKLKITYYFAGLILLYVLSILPNFIVVDRFFPYRMLTVMILLHIIILAHAVNQFKKAKLRLVIIISFSVITILAGYFNTNYAFIDIQKKEYQIADTFISQLDESINTLYVSPPGYQYLAESNHLSRVVSDEFGILSNSIPWVTEPFFQLLLNKYNLDIDVVILDAEKSAPLSKNSVIFDCEKEWANSKY